MEVVGGRRKLFCSPGCSTVAAGLIPQNSSLMGNQSQSVPDERRGGSQTFTLSGLRRSGKY